MGVDKLAPNDSRVERREARVNGRTYSYLFARPEGTPKGYIFLAHGFPDMAFGWRYQIPLFQTLGYEVIAPNMLGYGRTTTPSADDAAWSYKSMSDDIAALVATVWSPETRIILGGHDWGGALVWRVALWQPKLLLGVFSICTPFWSPNPVYTDLEILVKSGKLPNFGYQLQFGNPGEVEKHIKTPEDIRRFLLTLYGARTTDTQETAFTPEKGILFDRLPRLERTTPVVSEEELDEYVRVYMEGSGVVGPLSWYRMRKRVFEEELPLVGRGIKIQSPCLFVQATRDMTLTPNMAKGMGKNFSDLTVKKVEASHWAMWQTPERVNAILKNWLAETFDGQAKGSSL